MSEGERLILVGRVGGAFGVRGELRIRSFTADPKALLGFGVLRAEDGRTVLTLTGGRVAKEGLIARATGVGSKEAADALRGLELYAPRSALPPAEEDEFYLTDLIGLLAVGPDGAPLGRVRAAPNYGAGDLLEIEPPAGASWLVAFTEANAPQIDIPGGRIVIVRPEDAE